MTGCCEETHLFLPNESEEYCYRFTLIDKNKRKFRILLSKYLISMSSLDNVSFEAQ